MPEPSRATTSGAVFQDLRKLARKQGRGTDELLVFYVLEAFLRRLTNSAHARRFTLKGACCWQPSTGRRVRYSGSGAVACWGHLQTGSSHRVPWAESWRLMTLYVEVRGSSRAIRM